MSCPTYKARITVTIVILLLSLIFAAAPAVAQQAESPIKVKGDIFDFGYIPLGTSVKHTLYIQNDADTSLRITKVSPGCGCTSIPLKQREVGPGETLEVDLILDTGKIHPGEFKKGPRIYTDSRKRPQIVCSLTGLNYKVDGEDRQRILDIDPVSVYMPKDRESDTRKIVLTNLTKLTLIPRVIEVPNEELISADVPARAIVPGGVMEINLKVNDISGVKVDAILESLTISFNDPDHTRITIPIRVMK